MSLFLKQGQEIHGKDYIVSLLRSKQNPYVFMVLAMNLEKGEEYALELHEHDIFMISEGDQGLLEDPEPRQLAQLILDNLELYEQDGVQFLTCEQKIFFNSLWSDVVVSQVSKNKQLPAKHPA